MDLKSTYNKIAEDWHKDHQKDDWWRKGTDKFVAMIPKGARVLDVGCGGGHPTMYLVKKGLNVTGIDFSENLLKIAKIHEPRAKYILLDIYNLEKLNESFDGIYAKAVLLHVPKKDIPKIIFKLYDKLKPNRLIYVAVKEPNPGQKKEEVKVENDYGYRYERFFSYFTLSELKQYLKPLKLKIVYENIKKSGNTKWIQIIAQKKEV